MPPHMLEPMIRNMTIRISLLFTDQKDMRFPQRLRNTSIAFRDLLELAAQTGVTASQEDRLTVLTFKVTWLLSLHPAPPCLN
jgi:hypothetical protein